MLQVGALRTSCLFLDSSNQRARVGVSIIRGGTTDSFSTVRQDVVVWPQTSAAQGHRGGGWQNFVKNLFFSLLLLFFMLVCVRSCVCGRCVITVSSLNPRISSN